MKHLINREGHGRWGDGYYSASINEATSTLWLDGEWAECGTIQTLLIEEDDYIEKIVDLNLPYKEDVKRLCYLLAKFFKEEEEKEDWEGSDAEAVKRSFMV